MFADELLELEFEESEEARRKRNEQEAEEKEQLYTVSLRDHCCMRAHPHTLNFFPVGLREWPSRLDTL